MLGSQGFGGGEFMVSGIKQNLTRLLSWYAFLHAVTLSAILFVHFVLNIDMTLLGKPGKLLEAYFLDLLGRNIAISLSPVLWLILRLLTGSARMLPWRF
ncbi:hypothetical protein N9164_08700 [Draconibacterium sp.]|nr:hypothetical protein [Draconibacterium sp.]